MTKIVSEKTLELNIGAEILNLVRSMPSCGNAFWIGMKQNQEARTGLDELISNVPLGFHLALQFKSPWSSPPNGVPFRFSINERQHSHLARLANVRPSAVYYVFPNHNTFISMRNSSPELLKETYFLQVSTVPRLPPVSRAKETHLVETIPRLGGNPPRAVIRSDSVYAELLLVGEVLHSLLQDRPGPKSFLGNDRIQEWLREMSNEERHNARAIGQRLRGLATLCFESANG